MPVCPVLYIFFDASLSIVNFSTLAISFESLPECHLLLSPSVAQILLLSEKQEGVILSNIVSWRITFV